MKIRQSELFNKLIYKRNCMRDEFIKDQEKDFEEFRCIYDKKVKLLKNIYYFYFLALVFFAILMLITIKYFKSIKIIMLKVLVILSIVLFLLCLIPLFLTILFKIKWKKSKFGKNDNKTNSFLMNEECVKVAISVICLSENYKLLQSYATEQEILERKWQELTKKYVEAIDYENNYNATSEDYLNFYQKWLKMNS